MQDSKCLSESQPQGTCPSPEKQMGLALLTASSFAVKALPLVIMSSPSIHRLFWRGGTQIIITHSDLTEWIRSVQKTINSESRGNR